MLSALALVEQRSQREIIEEALAAYVAKLPARRRKMVEDFAAELGTQ